jgi:hypothetical protein
MLVPDWRRRWLTSTSPWLAALIAVTVFSPVLIWNSEHGWVTFRFQFVRAITNHDLSLRHVGEFIGLQFGLVGFVVLPVVMCGVVLTAWRGYHQRAAVPVLLSTCVLVPFFYFLWRSLTLRVGDTWPMFLWPAGFAATAINMAILPHEGWPARTVRLAVAWSNAALISGLLFVVMVFVYSTFIPWNLIGRNDPIGAEAQYEQIADRVQVEMRKTGATWIATSDYRTYAMMRWFFRGRAPVIQMNERARFIGFSDPGMDLIKGHVGLFVTHTPDSDNAIWFSTSAVREPLERIDRIWRGTVMDTYSLEKLTGWTPELAPPPDSPLFRWRELA